MTSALLALAGFFYWWMLLLIVPSAQSVGLIVLGTAFVVVYFGFVSKNPVHALYAFVGLSLFFPKGGNNFVFIQVQHLDGGVLTLFAILQLAVAVAVGIRALRSPRPPTAGGVRRFAVVCGLAVGVAFLMSIFLMVFGDQTGLTLDPQHVVWSVPVLSATLFLIGCNRLITRREEIERILFIILAFGAVLVFEWFLYGFLGLPLPLRDWVFHSSGRYMSFFLNDGQMVSLVNVTALAITMYFAHHRRSRWFWVLGGALMAPVVFTLQRGPLVAGAAVVVAMLALQLNWKRAALVSMGVFALLVAGLTSGDLQRTTSAVQGFYFAERSGIVSTLIVSAKTRVGSYLRGADVIIESFPLGVGPGLDVVKMWMVSSDVPSHFDLSRSWTPSSDFYSLILSGQHRTAPHNAFIRSVVEYGLLGAGAIAVLLLTMIGALRLHLRTALYLRDPLSTLGFGVLVGFIVQGFVMDVIVYWLVFFFFYVAARSPAASEPWSVDVDSFEPNSFEDPISLHHPAPG